MREGILGTENEDYFSSYLIVPDRRQGYIVYYDASKDELGCILKQSKRVVAYGSRQ